MEEKGEGKGDDEGKAGDTSEVSVFDRVQEYIMSEGLERDFEDFADEHAKTFVWVLDMKPGEEHPLEFHAIYQEYLTRFEGRIERFIESEGLSSFTFYKECEEILDQEEVFDMKRFFVETLLSTSKYETFVSLMKGEMLRHKDLERPSLRKW